MKNAVLRFLLMIAIGIFHSVGARAVDTGILLENLDDQIRKMDFVERDVEDLDRASFLLLKKVTTTLRESIGKHGQLFPETYKSAQSLFIWHRENQMVLKRFTTDKSAPYVDGIRSRAKDVSDWTQLDRMFSNITEFVYRQITDNIFLYRNQTQMSPEISQMLTDLLPELGDLGVIASDGDTSPTLEAGKKMHAKIELIQKRLSSIPRSQATDDLIVTIIGFNQYYGKVMRLQEEKRLK